MWRMFPVLPAEFFQFQFIRSIGPVFFTDIVLTIAHRADKGKILPGSLFSHNRVDFTIKVKN